MLNVGSRPLIDAQDARMHGIVQEIVKLDSGKDTKRCAR